MEQSNEFDLIIPIIKSRRTKNGNCWIYGVLTEIAGSGPLSPSGARESLPYLRKFGKFANGGRHSVGEILQADVLSKGALVDKGVLDAGSVPSGQLEDECLFVAGPLYGHVPQARELADALRSGARLGFQVKGSVIKKSAESPPQTIVTKIAITDSPVDADAWVQLQKSLGSPYLTALDVLAMGLDDFADSDGGAAKIEAPLDKCLEEKMPTMSREETRTIIGLAGLNNLIEPTIVAQHEINPASVPEALVKSLADKLKRKGLLAKSFHITELEEYNPTRTQTAELLHQGAVRGLVDATKPVSFELGTYQPTKGFLKSLQIELAAGKGQRR